MVRYSEIISPHEMHPSDMKYVEKVLRSAGIPVRNTGRETLTGSTKSLSVPARYKPAAFNIYLKLKYSTYKDKALARKVMKNYRG